MSFSTDVKDELVRIRIKSAAIRLSQLAGLTHSCGTLRLGRGSGVVYQTEFRSVANEILSLAGMLYPTLESTIELKEQQHRTRPLFVVTLRGDACETLLTDAGVIGRGKDGELLFECAIPASLIAGEEAQRAFLRGIFLGSGSCSNPQRDYHLEMVLRTGALCDTLCEMIAVFELTARHLERRDKHIVYLKSEDVAGFLALIGASAATLEFENVRTVKEMRNYVNRKSNCETANLGKTIDAGLSQVQAIECIEDHMGLSHLPQPLYEAAMLRLSHPDATLQELADRAEIGKSGMNHRLARLMRIAEEITHG